MTWLLWLALLTGHVMWSAHLLASYFVAALSCGSSASGWFVPLHAATVVGLAGTAGGLLAARAAATAGVGGDGADEPASERRFVGRVGLALGAVFLFATAMAGAMAFFLPPCA